MEIYPEIPLPEAYTKLALTWARLHNLTTDNFISIATQLFENYSHTYSKLSQMPELDLKWLQFITTLFRGIDCANPVTDFSGRIVLAQKHILEKLKLNINNRIAIKGIAVNKTENSGLNAIDEIAKYSHLKEAIANACKMAQQDFTQLFKQQKAYLEVYTCFPIVPLAFLYASGLATTYAEAITIIDKYPLTITGGMNLAKGAWNQPVLRAIIAMVQKLQQDSNITLGGIHGNGGLGEKQGFLILEKTNA
jgi:hypothetical protein